MSFSVPAEDVASDPASAITALQEELGAFDVDANNELGKVSLIGAGMRSHPGVAATMFRTLAELGINLEMISTSPIKISCMIAPRPHPRGSARRSTRRSPSNASPSASPRSSPVRQAGFGRSRIRRAVPRLRRGAPLRRPARRPRRARRGPPRGGSSRAGSHRRRAAPRPSP